jgi:hypothetical protein
MAASRSWRVQRLRCTQRYAPQKSACASHSDKKAAALKLAFGRHFYLVRVKIVSPPRLCLHTL